MKTDMLKGEEFCCCNSLFSSLEEDVFFLPRFKSFAFHTKADDYDTTMKLSWCFISHCPFCGTELPCLVSKYLECLERNCGELLYKYGYDDGAIKHLPPEFQTDEWWRKRGL